MAQSPKSFSPVSLNVGLGFQLGAFLLVAIAVAIPFELLIRPEAAEVRERNRVAALQEEAFVPERSLAVVLGDREQQICITLTLWGLLVVLRKFFLIREEEQPLKKTYLSLAPGQKIIPDNASLFLQQLREQLPETSAEGQRLIPRTIRTALQRLESTHSVQQVSEAVKELTQSTAEQLDTDLSSLRYTAWAIPSFGFIGTVRGIGEALLQADQAVRGDVSGVTSALGIAFNSTLVALVLSIPFMLLIHALQQKQESFALTAEEYCRREVVGRMKVPL